MYMTNQLSLLRLNPTLILIVHNDRQAADVKLASTGRCGRCGRCRNYSDSAEITQRYVQLIRTRFVMWHAESVSLLVSHGTDKRRRVASPARLNQAERPRRPD